MATVRTNQPAEVHRMRPIAPVPVLLLGPLLVAAAALPVAGQDTEPDRGRPDPFKQAQVATITNEMDDPVVNEVIFEAVRVATSEAGIQARRKPWEGSLPERNAIQAARDW